MFSCFTHTTGVGSFSMHARVCFVFCVFVRVGLYVFLRNYLVIFRKKKKEFLYARRGLPTLGGKERNECSVMHPIYLEISLNTPSSKYFGDNFQVFKIFVDSRLLVI